MENSEHVACMQSISINDTEIVKIVMQHVNVRRD